MRNRHFLAFLFALTIVGWVQGGEPKSPVKDKYGDLLPAGAVARFGTVRYRAAGKGGFLPDGKTIVSGYAHFEKAVKIWDALTGKVVHELNTDLRSMRDLALSPDGRYLAVSGFLPVKDAEDTKGAVLVWDTATWKMPRQWPRTDRDTDHCALAFSPKSDFLFSLGDSGLLRIEEVATGVEILNHQFKRDIMAAIAVSNDGAMVAVSTGPNTRQLFLWKWQEAEGPRELKVPDRVGRFLAFSPDSKLLAESGDTDLEIRIWQTSDGRLLQKLRPSGVDHYWHNSIVFTPDGKTLIAASHGNTSGAVHFWDVATWTHQKQWNHGAGHLAISPDGRLLTGGSRVWDIATGKDFSANDEGHRSTVTRIVVAGAVIATGSEDDTVRLWNETGNHICKISHGGHGIGGIALSPDGAKLVTASYDNSVCLWDADSGKRIYKLPGHGNLGFRPEVGFAADGKHFVSWGTDLYLRKWNAINGKAVLEHAIRPKGMKLGDEDAAPGRNDMKFLSFERSILSPDGQWLTLGAGGKFHIFDIATGAEKEPILREGGRVHYVAISRDSKYLIASAWGKPVKTLLPDGRTRYSSEKNHSVCVWGLATGKLLHEQSLPEGGVGAVAFSPNGKLYAAVANEPELIRVWEFTTHKEIGSISGYAGRIGSLAFTADSERLLTGMNDGSVLVWIWAPTKS